jgi:hypothetical protein
VPLIEIVVVLIAVGVLLWLVQSFIPMEANIKKILTAVVVMVVVLWLLGMVFDLGSLGRIRV